MGASGSPVGEVIDACAGDAHVTVGPGYLGGRPRSDPVTTAIGRQIVSQQASGTGNDVALDDISILDMTPSLSQAFLPASIPLWGSAVLTFTVTNTAELFAKNGSSFTDNLPAGVQVAASAQERRPTRPIPT